MMLRFSVITYTFGRLTTKKHNKVMKKLIFLFAFCLTVTNIFAQTDPSQLKKEGSDAFKYAEAVTFFDIAIQKKFNIGNAYARKALALDAMKKTDEYVATLEEGLKVDPDNKTMIKNYGLHYLKAGIAAQKAGKAEEAEECFKKVIPLDHKTYKTNALYSLGVLCYNDGANILKKAAPLANSDADKYAAEKEKQILSKLTIPDIKGCRGTFWQPFFISFFF